MLKWVYGHLTGNLLLHVLQEVGLDEGVRERQHRSLGTHLPLAIVLDPLVGEGERAKAEDGDTLGFLKRRGQEHEQISVTPLHTVTKATQRSRLNKMNFIEHITTRCRGATHSRRSWHFFPSSRKLSRKPTFISIICFST